MSGTTWKKRSRHGLPEERNVAELFSVKPIGGFGIGLLRLLKSETMRSMTWSPEDSAAAGVVDRLSCGGPRRLGGAMSVSSGMVADTICGLGF